MDKLVRNVFQVVGLMMLSLLLWSVIFGSTGRTLMWGAIEPAMQQHWAETTMNDGKLLSDTMCATFDAAKEYKLR